MLRTIFAVGVLVTANAASAAPRTTAALPNLTISNAGVHEGDRATLIVRLSRPSTARITVRFATTEISARPGVDYRAASGVVTFAPRQRTKLIRIATVDDDEAEVDETFDVRVFRPRNVRLGRRSARATIFASDLPGPFTTLATMDASRQTGGNPAASATATLRFDVENASVRSTVSARGLGDRGGFVHLHRGSAGAEGPELASLAGPWGGNGTATSTASLSRAVILQIHAAPTDFYVELHTLNGAIRGQLRRAY